MLHKQEENLSNGEHDLFICFPNPMGAHGAWF